MNRLDFLKKGFGSMLGVSAVLPIMNATAKESKNIIENATKATACTVTPTETAGPFPTITPASYVRSNLVTDSRTGVPLVVNIVIQNSNNSCAALADAIVDIWHCDKDGNYSEYGGTTMQSTNYTTVHFLRGRQTTNAAGIVTFNTIFPGWYSGRTTHIHVHIYNSSGTSLLVTQIAFPQTVTDYFFALSNGTDNGYGYTKGLSGYTYPASDNVFSDGFTNELATVTGDKAIGYVLTHTIVVAGSTGTACTTVGGTTNF